ncbi:MAG: hypothetical protein EAZ35_08845 [Sphingobacteriia bacterium]|nr:MAG: hypothetical protein EAZ35_08845 [Sphingobacteriia bacterium]
MGLTSNLKFINGSLLVIKRVQSRQFILENNFLLNFPNKLFLPILQAINVKPMTEYRLLLSHYPSIECSFSLKKKPQTFAVIFVVEIFYLVAEINPNDQHHFKKNS